MKHENDDVTRTDKVNILSQINLSRFHVVPLIPSAGDYLPVKRFLPPIKFRNRFVTA